jgi:hypothetical protein
MGFKGDFLAGRSRYYPLTVMDAYSGFLIACIALPNTQATGVRTALRDVFGLPHAIRSSRRRCRRAARGAGSNAHSTTSAGNTTKNSPTKR